MFIRYFAHVDDSSIGKVGAEYCDALVATGIPVRLVSICLAQLQHDRRGRCSSAWDRHRALLATPMDGDFVNVVCGELADWNRLYTSSRTNVLFVADQNFDPRNSQSGIVEAMAKYDSIFASSAELATVVERVTCRRPIVLAPEVKRAGPHLRMYLA